MVTRVLLLVSLALVLLACAAYAGNAPFFFVQIADPQLGFNNKNVDIVPELATFGQAVADVNKLKPAFVLISGDAVNKPHDPTQIRAFWRVAHEINQDIPLHIVPGNHDVAAGTAADVDSYKKLFGSDHYCFSVNGSVFIVVDSGIFGKDGDATTRVAQRSWFEGELKAARAKRPAHIFVCDHHPWFLKTRDEADRYQDVPIAYRLDYLDLMRKYGVEYALAGHLHYDLVVKDGDLTIVAGGPISKSVAKTPVLGLRIWKVYQDRVETEFYPLDKVPASVKL